MTINNLIDRSHHELILKVCSAIIQFIICSRHIVQVICVCVVILFSCLNITLICIKKNRSLFDLCMKTLNEIGLRLYCSYIMFYCLYCFISFVLVFLMFLPYITVLYCIDVRLSHLNRLLTYLHSYLLKTTLTLSWQKIKPAL